MKYFWAVFQIAGGLCLFLYGMKIMSGGIQQAAGARMRKILTLMTGNRLLAVLTGCAVTAVIQSSSATTVMVVSFVNAGLLTLKQAIGVIMGANIGTTATAWIVSLVGFSLNLSALALPAVGAGFILGTIKWKHQALGEAVLGFGLLFLGLDFLTKSMPDFAPETFAFITKFSGQGVLSLVAGTSVGLVMTLITHSSSASTAIMLTMAHAGLLPYRMAAAMILGANIGTTIDAALAAIGTRPAAKQAALVHVLFNVIGTVWALIFFDPLLALVDFLVPGVPGGAQVSASLAMFHTVFNTVNTLLFFPFVNPFARLVSALVKKDGAKTPEVYTLEYRTASMQDTPEFNILRAEKEIRDMADLAHAMYGAFSAAFISMESGEVRQALDELKTKEEYADAMREELSRFLIECTRHHLNPVSKRKVAQLLRIIVDLEDMTDDCYSLMLILERSVRKEQVFKAKEREALAPYILQVEAFLVFVGEQLGKPLRAEHKALAAEMENNIDKARKKLRRLGRKRIEAGKNVKTELLFIDMVRRIEKLGDYCYNIVEALSYF
ncbi:MAG: Na/Pi cotransporter family protein [Spirochaetaceae bacterium]|jgi:phosphate:Na+ symporter|nr:Na/Pi cotransporter family protein [Spirochaetaceae bacterium]